MMESPFQDHQKHQPNVGFEEGGPWAETRLQEITARVSSVQSLDQLGYEGDMTKDCLRCFWHVLSVGLGQAWQCPSPLQVSYNW